MALQASAEPTNDKKTTGEVRRDPEGIKGISPFWEALKAGDNAYIARDFDAAVEAYRKAITAEPRNPTGHLRMGEAQVAKGDMEEGEKSYTAASRFAAKDPVLKAKALFLLADLRERQKNHKEARDRWAMYADFAKEQQQAKAHPKTAADRSQRVEQWQKLQAEYAPVKERIKKRLEEAEEKARKSAK
jgi:tetratricopeptide (TPR) repeat protein